MPVSLVESGLRTTHTARSKTRSKTRSAAQNTARSAAQNTARLGFGVLTSPYKEHTAAGAGFATSAVSGAVRVPFTIRMRDAASRAGTSLAMETISEDPVFLGDLQAKDDSFLAVSTLQVEVRAAKIEAKTGAKTEAKTEEAKNQAAGNRGAGGVGAGQQKQQRPPQSPPTPPTQQSPPTQQAQAHHENGGSWASTLERIASGHGSHGPPATQSEDHSVSHSTSHSVSLDPTSAAVEVAAGVAGVAGVAAVAEETEDAMDKVDELYGSRAKAAQGQGQRSAVAGQNESGPWLGALSATIAAVVLFACY